MKLAIFDDCLKVVVDGGAQVQQVTASQVFIL